MYRPLRGLLFRADAERVHEFTIATLERLSASRLSVAGLSRTFGHSDERLGLDLFGLTFPGPVGLAAGLDKDGRAVPAWQAMGFGFVEVGSVTALPQEGNPRPRLFRLPADEALVNRMGFNNRGAGALAERIARLRRHGGARVPIFVNVGKSRAAPLERAVDDFRRALAVVWSVADGVVINVSSPNTPRLRELQRPEALDPLLGLTEELRRERKLPVLLKLAPDLELAQLEAIAQLAERRQVDGLVAVNTTVARQGLTAQRVPEGGLSGRPLAARSREVLAFLARHTSLPLVSVGGIFDSAEAVARVRAGASLLELYTGLIYRGPGLVREIERGLIEELEREGLGRLDQLIGIDR